MPYKDKQKQKLLNYLKKGMRIKFKDHIYYYRSPMIHAYDENLKRM